MDADLADIPLMVIASQAKQSELILGSCVLLFPGLGPGVVAPAGFPTSLKLRWVNFSSSRTFINQGLATPKLKRSESEGWWLRLDSNQRPTAYDAVALPLSYRAVQTKNAKCKRQNTVQNQKVTTL